MGSGDDVWFRSATEVVRMLRQRKVSSVELLKLFLARRDRVDSGINAVVTVDPERALREAAEADALTVRGRFLGPLHGLPMTVKDTFEVEGLRTTAGAETLSAHVPDQDADAVAALRAAGAVIFGKTNVPAYARDVQTHNEVFGTTGNPWRITRTAGGSSGGAAAAVAAGLTALEIGSDLAGSLRLPAHYCGVLGLRPTHGITPTRGHIPRPPGWLTSSDMVSVGPLCRAPEDLALALDVLTAPARSRAAGWRLHLPEPRHDALSSYRVGVLLDDPHCPVDSAVGDVLTAAVDQLRAAGAKVSEEPPPVDLAGNDQLFQQLMFGTTSTGWADDAFAGACAAAEQLTPGDDSARARLLRGTTQRLREWHMAHERRERLRRGWEEYFRSHDVLLCPVAPTAAIPHDHRPDPGARTITVNGQTRPYWDQTVWAGLAAVAHLPAAAVPAGRTRDGLPVGIQIIGPYLEDRTVIDLASRLTRLLGGFAPPPGLTSPPA
ncbi:amidase [Streptomyces sp. NBC_01803]|uniref:amidase n=1 Tax=Streptomyces sp. NBC_01803 TaxID=2975946 RepID=UPI002DD823FE|nr:amidase [Streptomyces sp. NBC_01803]WSA42818.1 amidase [Streptomyces sp. NBC_01803]